MRLPARAAEALAMWYLYGLALVAGIATAVEPGQNASLAKATDAPLFAGLVCCALGGLIFAALMLAGGRAAWPDVGRMAQAPWWAWPSGVLGAAVLVGQLYASQRIGAAPFLCIVVTAGVATSLLLDHLALVGFAQHAASPGRLAGAGLMIAGVVLVALF